ncbi:MAG: InlB B-repeat-containing protein [Kiritimatiellae bacterium]|nr:InlB B-repeat-containing protein [Kiritimatiellia bacterium]
MSSRSRAFVFAACAAFCLAGDAATRRHDGLEYSTSAVRTGVWSAQFTKCRKYAEKRGLPLVVMWVNPGCGHCRALCNSMASSSSFTKWRKSCGYVFALGIGRKSDSGKAAHDFAKSGKFGTPRLNTFPFCAVYLNPRGGESPSIKKVFTGSGLTASDFRSKVKTSLKDYAKIWLKAGKGGTVVQVRWQKKGKKVTIKARPRRGYRFLGWYDSTGKRFSKKASCKVKVKKNVTYTAKFKKG